MRPNGLAFAFSLLLAAAPFAAGAEPHPPIAVSEVKVAIGPRLEAKAKDYGQDQLDMLAGDLKKDVQDALQRKGRLGSGGARLELTIVDAKPDHPTPQQLMKTPGLDYARSVGRGMAVIDGFEIQPNGARRHLHFEYEPGFLGDARVEGTWGDAENTFEWFAQDYAAGKR
jgi:hypothetical protein